MSSWPIIWSNRCSICPTGRAYYHYLDERKEKMHITIQNCCYWYNWLLTAKIVSIFTWITFTPILCNIYVKNESMYSSKATCAKYSELQIDRMVWNPKGNSHQEPKTWSQWKIKNKRPLYVEVDHFHSTFSR